MSRHILKTWPEFFEAVLDGSKRFELRKNDRGFAIGDMLLLREYSPALEKFLGRAIEVRVTYLVQGEFGLPEDVCVMSIERTDLAALSRAASEDTEEMPHDE